MDDRAGSDGSGASHSAAACAPNAAASSVPISRENERLAATTRASISTCCDLRSSWRSRLSRTGKNARDVADDQGVGAAVRQDVAARRQELLHRGHQVRGLGVAQHASGGDDVSGFGLRLGQLAILVGFLLQGFLGRDAQDIAIELLVQIVVLEDDIKSLVPWHIVENDRQGALHRRVHNDVQAADFVNQAEEVAQVHVFQVHGDRFTRIFSSRGWRRSLLRARSSRRSIDGGLAVFAYSPRWHHSMEPEPQQQSALQPALLEHAASQLEQARQGQQTFASTRSVAQRPVQERYSEQRRER